MHHEDSYIHLLLWGLTVFWMKHMKESYPRSGYSSRSRSSTGSWDQHRHVNGGASSPELWSRKKIRTVDFMREYMSQFFQFRKQISTNIRCVILIPILYRQSKMRRRTFLSTPLNIFFLFSPVNELVILHILQISWDFSV